MLVRLVSREHDEVRGLHTCLKNLELARRPKDSILMLHLVPVLPDPKGEISAQGHEDCQADHLESKTSDHDVNAGLVGR